LHGYKTNTAPSDIDLVYFDKEEKRKDEEIQNVLFKKHPAFKWEVVNQANTHLWNDDAPYISTEDAISKWPETATAVGVKLEKGELKLVAPLGIDDLVQMIVRPTPTFMASQSKMKKVKDRFQQKQWSKKWPKLKVVLE
jgi:hypothetical protein